MMPTMNVKELIAELSRHDPETPVVVPVGIDQVGAMYGHLHRVGRAVYLPEDGDIWEPDNDEDIEEGDVVVVTLTTEW